MCFFEEKLEKLDKQMIIHHCIGLNMMMTAFSGWFVTNYACLLMGMEVSSIPLLLRRYVEEGSFADKANKWALFFTYIIFRILLCAMMIVLWPTDACGVYDRMGTTKFVAFFDFFAHCCLFGLSLFWFYIMLKKWCAGKKETQ